HRGGGARRLRLPGRGGRCARRRSRGEGAVRRGGAPAFRPCLRAGYLADRDRRRDHSGRSPSRGTPEHAGGRAATSPRPRRLARRRPPHHRPPAQRGPRRVRAMAGRRAAPARAGDRDTDGAAGHLRMDGRRAPHRRRFPRPAAGARAGEPAHRAGAAPGRRAEGGGSMSGLSEDELVAIEREAVELASLAGARIKTALGRTLAVRYKENAEGDISLRDPVSEVDHDVEGMIREKVAALFPGHDVLGEESEERPARDHDVVWAVDPIDGTTNFVNGYPLFAASIGVLYRGKPVVGAVWCSTSHALRAGVYHAR